MISYSTKGAGGYYEDDFQDIESLKGFEGGSVNTSEKDGKYYPNWKHSKDLLNRLPISHRDWEY